MGVSFLFCVTVGARISPGTGACLSPNKSKTNYELSKTSSYRANSQFLLRFEFITWLKGGQETMKEL